MVPLMTGVRQVGYVVRDLAAAIDLWSANLQAGPFFVVDVAMPGLRYRGQPTQARWTTGLGFSGSLLIELICPADQEPSVYREFTEAGRHGPHHVLLDVENYDAKLTELQGAGLSIAFEQGEPGGERFVYLDALGTLGCFIELYDMHPRTRQMFKKMELLNRKWTGRDPVRPLAELLA